MRALRKTDEGFFQKTSDFKSASIAMITFLPPDRLAKFSKQYALSKYPNIYFGTEGSSFLVRNYYKIMDLPFAALYSKEGNLIKTYRKNISVKEMSSALHVLK